LDSFFFIARSISCWVNILVLFIQLGAFLMAFAALQEKVDAIDKRLERMENSFDKIYIRP